MSRNATRDSGCHSRTLIRQSAVENKTNSEDKISRKALTIRSSVAMTIEFSLLIEHSPPRGLVTLSGSPSSNHPAFCAPGSVLSPSANHPSALPSSFLKRASARKPRAGGQEGVAQSAQVPSHPGGSAISKRSRLCFLV